MELPNNHTPQLHEARFMQLNQREHGVNLLNNLTEIKDDLNNMGLNDKEQEVFELGMYLMLILNREVQY